MGKVSKQPLKYIGEVYAHVEHWYEIADKKAQIVLALDGAFLSFVAGMAFTGSADLSVIIECGGAPTILFLVLMALSLAVSILAAMICLHPRLHAERGATESMLRTEVHDHYSSDPVPTRLLWFFGHLAQLDQERVARQLLQVDDAVAAEAIAFEAAKFSRNVYRKHVWIDYAFLFAGSSLIFLLLAAATYWWQFASCNIVSTVGA